MTTAKPVTESTFRYIHNGGEAITRSAREALAAWESGDIESVLDALDGIANDAQAIKRRASEAYSEFSAAKK